MHHSEQEGELGSHKQPVFSFISLHYTCMGSKERTERSFWPKMRVRGQIQEVPLLQEEQNPQSHVHMSSWGQKCLGGRATVEKVRKGQAEDDIFKT